MPVIAYKYIDKVELLLPKSKMVAYNKKNMAGLGLYGKVTRFFMVGVMMLFWRVFNKKGLIDVVELERVPRHLRCAILIPLLGCFGGLLVLFTYESWTWLCPRI
jgi:hypothetical protein